MAKATDPRQAHADDAERALGLLRDARAVLEGSTVPEHEEAQHGPVSAAIDAIRNAETVTSRVSSFFGED